MALGRPIRFEAGISASRVFFVEELPFLDANRTHERLAPSPNPVLSAAIGRILSAIEAMELSKGTPRPSSNAPRTKRPGL